MDFEIDLLKKGCKGYFHLGNMISSIIESSEAVLRK
jgi:hypothetical protein